jgi:hypothetical protein
LALGVRYDEPVAATTGDGVDVEVLQVLVGGSCCLKVVVPTAPNAADAAVMRPTTVSSSLRSTGSHAGGPTMWARGSAAQARDAFLARMR